MSRPFDEELNLYDLHSAKWTQYKTREILPMANADMDVKSPDCVIEACVRAAQVGYFGYTNWADDFYISIAGWYERHHNWKIDPDWICSGPGIWSSMRMFCGAMTKPGDSIIVQSPTFGPIPPIIKDCGCRVIANPMILKNGRYELDFEDFERKIIDYRPKIYIMINPQNPTGRAFTKEELIRLNDICYRHGVLVIADEVHCNVIREGYTHYPNASVSDAARKNTVIITSASKGYNIMGMSYATVIIPNPEIREQWLKIMKVYGLDFAFNVISVAAVTAAMSEKADDWLKEVNQHVGENLLETLEFFKEKIPEIQLIYPEAGYLIWMDCRGLGMSQSELKKLFLEEAKVGVTLGEIFGVEGIGFERLNIGVTKSVLREGLNRIYRAVDAHRRK